LRGTNILLTLFAATALLVAISIPSQAAAPHNKHMSMAKPGTPIQLLPEALGTYEWQISTDSPEAQAFFNQGMQLRWAYNMPESVASMVRARELDPTCAMCFWGEAFSRGSFLNGGMGAEQAAAARIAIRQANRLKADSSPMEQALIEAALVRYPEDYDPAERRPVDQAFADAMAGVYAKYPNNHDVAAVYAVSLFLLENRRGYRDLADRDLQRLHGVLTGVLAEDIKHPGACHLYIHATESSQKPELALDCADHLASTVPVASHIQHMPSHTWNEVGLWGRSVRANIAANNADRRAAQGKGFSYGPTHNLHMLLFAASYDGQGAVATQAGKDYRKYAGDAQFEATTLIRFGRFDEVLELDHRPKGGASAAIYDFAKGYAMLKSGSLRDAQDTLATLQDYAATTDDKIRFHPAKNVVGVLVNILAGEIQLTGGRTEAAIESFELAVALEDSLDYDEPEPLPFAARHWLGQALLDADQPTKAEAVFRAELKDHPHNGWSLFGLQQALAAQGVSDNSVNDDFEQSWARADIWLTGSKY
jgi:tetratricopeptide (TPR) repeat protein